MSLKSTEDIAVISEWRDLLPEEHGPLTFGRMLRRTDASGQLDAKVVVLGVYPAATEWKVYSHGSEKLKLPTAVEGVSIEPSSLSGGDLDRLYLGRELLDLPRSECLMVFMRNSKNESQSEDRFVLVFLMRQSPFSNPN